MANTAKDAVTSSHEAYTGPRISEAAFDEIATSPNASQDVPTLLNQISANGQVFVSEPTYKIRMDLLEQARALVYALETPREAMIRYCWSQVRDDSTDIVKRQSDTVPTEYNLCGNRNQR